MRKALVKRGGQIIEVDVDDNHVNQLDKAQKGKQIGKPVYDEYGDEIMSSKHRTRRGKDFQKYTKYNPDSEREYIEKQWFDPNTNQIRTTTRNRGSLYNNYESTRDANTPNPYIDIEKYINPYRTDFNQQPTMLPGMQIGGEESKYPLNDQGEEIRYHKEFDRRGKRITKEKLVTPADLEEGTKSTTRYVKRILDDNGQGRTISRPSGIDYFYNPRRSDFFGEPRDGSYIDNEINPNFNQQPRMFQMGGAPQEQMAQQQMPPQQEGQAQGSQQDQIMQLIQAYADAMGISPEEIIQELQQMDPQEQKQAIDQMAQELQGGQQAQAQAPEQQMSPEQMMQVGGANNIYTPDTGTEQYAPDPSWYEGGDQAAGPGNVVSWPSFPEGGRPMRRNIPNGTREVTPIETETRRIPRGRGTSTFFRNPSVPEQEYDDSSYDYEDDYTPVRRVPFFENVADRVGDGFDNVGDFFKRLKRKRRGGRGRRRGNGLLNCKPGTDCFKHQEGGPTNGELDIDRFKPESKLQTFLQLAQSSGQDNYDKALEKDVYNEIKKFQSGGYVTDANGKQQYTLGHNFNPMLLDKAYQRQEHANSLKRDSNTGEAFWKLFGTAAKSAQNLKSGMSGMGAKPAAGGAASAATPATGAPAATPAVPAAAAPTAGGADPMKALSGIFGGSGGGDAAGALAGMDLSALAGFLRYGGSLPTAGEGGLFKKILPIAAGVAGTAFAGPIGGMVAKKAVSGMVDGGGGGGAPAAGGGGGGFDPSALVSMFAKRGGSLPRYQSNVTTGQVGTGLGSFSDQFLNSNKGATGSGFAPFSDVYKSSFGESKEPLYFSENTELPPVEPDNSMEAWRKQMQDNSAATEDGKNWDPLQFTKKDMEKYNLNTTENNVTQKPMGFQGFMQATKGMGPATAGFVEAWGNKRKAKRAQNQADMALLSDNLATATTADTIDRGKRGTNTFMANGDLVPDANPPMGPFATENGKYGMQVAKVGTQVQNPYMSNPNSHPEAVLYGEPDPKVSNTLKPVKRENANLEAEVGEVAVTPGGADGVPKFFKVGGKNHYDGGTPLSLPENTFIFSKTRSMIIKDPEILKELTGSTKPATPADLAKKFDFSDYVAIIQNKNSDPVERKTAEMMIESMMYKLGQIAIIQEAKKGFPSGIPLIAGPYLEKTGIDPQMLLPQTEEPEQEDPGMQQQMDPAMQEQMMQQPQEQMDPRMMQEQMEPMPEEMGQPTMQKGGRYKSTERYDYPETREQAQNRFYNEMEGKVSSNDGDERQGFNRDMYGIDHYIRKFQEAGLWDNNESMGRLTKFIPKPVNLERQYDRIPEANNINNYPAYMGDNVPIGDPRYKVNLLPRKPSEEEYAYGGSTWVPPDEELLSMGYAPDQIQAIKLADKKSPVFDSEASYNNIAYNAVKAKAYGTEKDAARYATYAKDRLDQALRDGMPLQSLQFSENRPVLSNDKRRKRTEDFDKNRERNQQGTPTENINDYESRMKREATFRNGGTNIMGGPVLPIYQKDGQVKSKYSANPMKAYAGYVHKGFSGDSDYEDEFKIKYPIQYNAYKEALANPNQTNVTIAKDLLEQALQATGRTGWDWLPRSETDKFEDLQDILDSELEKKTYYQSAGKELNRVKNIYTGLEQEKKDLWAALNSDKAKTDYTYAAKLQKQYQDVNDFLTKNKRHIPLMEKVYNEGIFEGNHNYFERNWLPNLNKGLFDDNTLTKEFKGIFNKGYTKYRENYPDPIVVPKSTSSSNTKSAEKPSAAKMAADSASKSTPVKTVPTAKAKTTSTQTATPTTSSNSGLIKFKEGEFTIKK